MGIHSILLASAGALFGAYGIYLAAVRSRRESALERAYRKAWGDTDPEPNPYVLRNNRYVGFLIVIIGFGLAALVVAAGLQE